MALDDEWTFAELRDDATSAINWLEALGIPSRGHRLQRLIKDLGFLVKATERGDLGMWAEDNEFRAAMFTLVEAADLRRVHHVFGTHASPGLVDKLRLAVKGPRAGTIDTDGNEGVGRNYLAEVSFAAVLVQHGQAIDLDHRPDVLSFPSLPLVGDPRRPAISWEVKRPQSFDGVERALRDATEQIRVAVEEGVENADVAVIAGVPVLVLDHIIPPFFAEPFSNAALLRAAVQVRLEAWTTEHRPLLRRSVGPHVAGVAVFWRPIGRLAGPGGRGQLPIECRQLRFEGQGFPARGYAELAASALVRD